MDTTHSFPFLGNTIKRILSTSHRAVLSVLVASIIPLMSHAQDPDLDNGLIAHFAFNGSAEDVSGNNLESVLEGNPQLTTDRHGNEEFCIPVHRFSEAYPSRLFHAPG